MTSEEKSLLVRAVPVQPQGSTRRAFLHRAAIAGAVGAGSLFPFTLPGPKASALLGRDDRDDDNNDLKRRDHDILIAAEIAEALAVTTYTNIIDGSPFFSRLPSDDQGYLVAARQEEMSHYLLEQSVTDEPTPFKSFFYPKGMFEDAQTTLNVLVTLEDAFIAAYLVGVRQFSTADLRVTAARIMGIESDHRTLARVLAGDVASGAQGVAEPADPPNNNGYERTLCWKNINQAVDALTPFADMNAAKAAGFDVSISFGFDPFTPKLPNPLGEFISFHGC